MLDEDMIEAAPPDEHRAKTSTFVLSATGLGVLLSAAFFPVYFSIVENYDDEGSFLVAIQVALGTFLAAGAGFWPVAFWHDYAKATPLELPGARFVRLDPTTVKAYRHLTRRRSTSIAYRNISHWGTRERRTPSTRSVNARSWSDSPRRVGRREPCGRCRTG